MAAHMCDRGSLAGKILTRMIQQPSGDFLLSIVGNHFELADDSGRMIQIVKSFVHREAGVHETQWFGLIARAVDGQKHSVTIEVLLRENMLLKQFWVHPRYLAAERWLLVPDFGNQRRVRV